MRKKFLCFLLLVIISIGFTGGAWGDGYSGRPGNGTSGTVTSIGLSEPAEFTVSGSPVTSSGTITVTKAVQAPNTIYSGPTTGAATAPTFRSLVTNDLPAATGTVTSVALTMPAELSVAGSPITTSGTLTVTKATQSANIIYAGPASGAAAQPAFRGLVTNDLPAGTGTVTSVGLVGDGTVFNNSVTNSPVTTVGTLTPTLHTQIANTIFSGPSGGGATTPTFRALVTADMPAGTGTVTSVALSAPAEFTVSGSPVTTAGTLTFTKATQAANTIYSGPASGASVAPAFRALGLADYKSIFLNQERIYLTAGAPYTDTASSTNLYFGPTEQGDLVSFWNGSAWVPQTVSEATLALSSLTANNNYDVYAASAGSSTATLTTTIWTNDTTPPARGTQDGHLTANGDATKLLVGSFRAVDATHGQDTSGSRWISNVYNTAPRPLLAADSTVSWTYSTATLREANASGVDGVSRVSFLSYASVPSIVTFDNFSRFSSAVANRSAIIGIGLDSTTVEVVSSAQGVSTAASSGAIACSMTPLQSVGYHFLTRLESAATGLQITLYGSPQGIANGLIWN